MNKKEARVTVSIALYGSIVFTIQCLEELFEKTPIGLYQVILFNNNSPDDTMKWLNENKKNFPKDKVKIFDSKINLNFAGAHNYVAKHCNTEYILFLNNDVIPTQRWLEPMVKILDEKPKVAVVGSKLIHPWNNSIQHAGVMLAGLLPVHKYFNENINVKESNISTDVIAVTGASFLIRRKLFIDMGGFDENYKNGWEDPDLCLRLYENGYQTWYEPKSLLYHYEGISEGRLVNDDNNRQYFFRVWGKKLKKWAPEFIKKGYMYAGRLASNLD